MYPSAIVRNLRKRDTILSQNYIVLPHTVITEKGQNARGEQDQRSSQSLPLSALPVHPEHDDSPQKAEPRDSRGSEKFNAEFNRENAIHCRRLTP
jgi:hypothetical protein